MCRNRIAQPLIVVGRGHPARLTGSILFQCCQHGCAGCLKVLRQQMKPQLSRLQRLSHSLQQVGKGASLPPQLCIANDDLGSKICTVVQKIIFLPCAVSAGFHCQKAGLTRFVQPDRFVDDVFVAPLKAMMAAAQLLLDESGKLVAGHGIGHNGAVRRLLRRNRRRQCDQPVAPQLGAVGLHRTCTVHIGIKYQPQITAACQYSAAEAFHRLLVFRVWHMVGEGAVRLQIHACGNIGAQRRQHPRSIKATRPVSGVHGNLHTGKGALAALHAGDDTLPQHCRIRRQNIKRGQSAMQPCRFGSLCSASQQLLNIGRFEPARFGKEFQSVAVLRQVTGSDHHCTVKVTVRQYRCHKHGRGACHAAIRRHRTHGSQTGQHCPLQAGAGKTAVPPHCDL